MTQSIAGDLHLIEQMNKINPPQKTFKKTSNVIDLLIKYSTDARWDVVSKAIRIIEIDYLRKQISEDGFRL